MAITYTASSLAEIAKLFETLADNAALRAKRAPTKAVQRQFTAAAATWIEAAIILRATTIEQPTHPTT